MIEQYLVYILYGNPLQQKGISETGSEKFWHKKYSRYNLHDANLLGGADKLVDYLKAAGREHLKAFAKHTLYVESGYDIGTKTYKCPDYCLHGEGGLLCSWDLKVS